MKTTTTAFTLFLLTASVGVAATGEKAAEVKNAGEKIAVQIADDLAPPVVATAGGQPLGVGGYGHATPAMGDFDNDGKMDLLVGQFTGGRLRIYRNFGTNAEPKFDKFEWFKAGGEIASVPIWCCIGFGPQLVDFDNDGRTDMLSGSRPGQLFLFRRLEDGTFAEREMIKDKNGEPIKPGMSAAVFAHDWDSDGDLDLIVGTAGGKTAGGNVWIIPNEGSRGEPAFGEKQPIEAAGEPVKSPGGCPGPSVADWDGDGDADLLLGSGSGAVLWYRNTGRRGKPSLQPPVTLVPKSSIPVVRRTKNEKPKPIGLGRRTKVCAVDFNGDGRLDLLVGDYKREIIALPPLPPDIKTILKKLDEKYIALLKERNGLLKAPPDESEEAKVERQKKIAEKMTELGKINAERVKRKRTISVGGQGWVWLFLRR